MQANHANKSLFTLETPGLAGVSFTLNTFHYQETLSSSDSLEIQVRTADGLSPGSFIGKPCHLSWDWKGSEQHYHGRVKGISIQPENGHQSLITLICESPLIHLKIKQHSRHFIYMNLQAIIKEVIKTSGVDFLDTVFHLIHADPERDFTAQHNETDLSFIERILHEVAWSYSLVHSLEGVTFHVYDHSADFPQLSHPVSYQPLAQGTKSIESIFELTHALDSEEFMHAKSDCLGMRAGQGFSLSGHPIQTLNQGYLIVSVDHRVDETSASLRYQNSLRLLPASRVFCPAYCESAERINTISMAQIHSDDEAPLLTERGEYILRSPHNNELTHPVRLATPYAGQDYGMHFPLHRNTQVLVAYLNGHPDQPVLLGSLYNDEQSNVVTSENARQNRWVTHSGHTLLLDDQPANQKIFLHTPEQQHRLLLDATEGKEKIELVSETGEFQATISQSTEFKTEDHYQLNAGESIEMVAIQDCHFASDEANFACDAARDILHQAGQDMSLHAEKDMQIRVDGNSETTIKGSQRTDIQGGDYVLKLAAGNLSHQARGNLQFTTQSGDIVLKTAQASVTFKADGDIVFSAKQIILQASNIDIHNAGQGKGN